MIRRRALTLTRISLNPRPQLNPIPPSPKLYPARCLSSSPSYFHPPSLSRDPWSGVPAIRSMSTRSRVTSDSSGNRPPTETILLDGCDFEHWLVVVNPPDPNCTRDQIIDGYIKTLAQVIGSEQEARMKIYSVSTKHYFAFGALVSEELSYKIKELENVRWVLPDSYLDVRNKDYGGEPFINGEAVPYDPKYHELWVRNNQEAERRNRNPKSRGVSRRSEPRPSTPPTPMANPNSLGVQTHPNYQAQNPQVQRQSISYQPPNNGFQNQYVRQPMQNPQSQNIYTPQGSHKPGPNNFVPSSMQNENAPYNNMQPQNSGYPGTEMPPSSHNGFPSKDAPSPMQNSGYQYRDTTLPMGNQIQNSGYHGRDVPPAIQNSGFPDDNIPPPAGNQMQNPRYPSREIPPLRQQQTFSNRDNHSPVQNPNILNRDMPYRDDPHGNVQAGEYYNESTMMGVRPTGGDYHGMNQPELNSGYPRQNE